MKLKKKMVISNTILFAGIIGFILAFGGLFGDENILIGVSTITAMLMLLERDLTSHPIGNTLKFVVLNLFIGVAAFLTGFNPFLAVPINFVAMFVISYSLLFSLKNPLYLPFSLQYLFILAVPVATDQMPLRLASLVFGALAIMGIQLLANKKKITKSGDKKIQTICEALIQKTKRIKNREAIETINQEITTDISGLRSIIYDKREDKYYLTEEGRLKLNISASLEKITILLDTNKNDDTPQEFLDFVIECLQLATDSLTNKESLQKLEVMLSQLLSKYEIEHTHSSFVLRMLTNIGFLKDSLIELNALGKEHYNLVKNVEEIPKKFQQFRISETKSHTNSIKFSYAVRMAVAISVTGFIVDFFEITEGRWMMFTVLSVIIPIYEQSTKKMRDRIFATAVGSVLVTVLFMFIHGSMLRSILLMTAGYLMSYVKVYRYSTILVTFSAIGAAALISGTTEILTLHRVLLVVAGVVLALLINKFILPYKMEDANNDLKEMYNDTITEMLIEVNDQVKGTGNYHAMKNLLLISNMIEDRLKLNNQGNSSEKGIAWLQSQRRATSTIYELYWWIYKHSISESLASTVSSHLELLINRSASEDTVMRIEIEMNNQIRILDRIEDKLVLTLMLEIMDDIRVSKTVL